MPVFFMNRENLKNHQKKKIFSDDFQWGPQNWNEF